MLKIEVQKQVERHYQTLVSLGYDVVGVFLYGSQNYELDYDKSDVDTKAIVLPSREDIAYNRQPVNIEIDMGDNCICDVKDIRKIFECFRKQNMNYIELLFTRYYKLNPIYEKVFSPMLEHAEEIARYNNYASVNCMYGMVLEKYNALTHLYPSIREKMERYGYDNKQLHHILRMKEFMIRYCDGEAYRSILIPENKEELLRIKSKYVYSLEDAKRIAKETCDFMKEYKESYLKNNSLEISEEAEQVMESVLNQLLDQKNDNEASQSCVEWKQNISDIRKCKNQPVLYVMVGLTASGKTTNGTKIAKELEGVIISSDDIRDEICEGGVIDQTNNKEVFQIFHQRIRENLKAGKDVIADSTNISMKTRRSLLESVRGIPCYKIAYILPKSVEKCIEDNVYKDHPVPHHVIQKQMMNFQIPFQEEGFDQIMLHQLENTYVNDVFVLDCYKRMQEKHGEMVCDAFMKLETYKDTEYIFAARMHDIGKLFTEKIDEEGMASYYQHENVGCYYLLSNFENIKRYGNYTDEQILNILFLVNYHSMPRGWDTDKKKNRWKSIFGQEKYQMLLEFCIGMIR